MSNEHALSELKKLGDARPLAIRGEGSFLFRLTEDTPDKSGLGLVVTLDTRAVAILPFHGVLSRGYWEPYTGDMTASELASRFS